METNKITQVINMANTTSFDQIMSEDEESPTFIFDFATASFEDSDIEDCPDSEDKDVEDKSDFEDINMEYASDFEDIAVNNSSEYIIERSYSFDGKESDGQNEGANNSISTWKEGTTPPNKLPFTGKTGLQVKMENTTPLDYFRLMITDEMVANLVKETNRYAAQTLKNKKFSPSSRYRKWTEIKEQEMWAFLGLIVTMGLIVVDDLEDYWSADPLYKLPFFSSVMTRDQFLLILSFLHVSNCKDQMHLGQAGLDPIFQIRNFVDSLINNFKSVFYPGDKVCVDEGMVGWRGPLSFQVYDAHHQEKCGIKVFQLCDTSTSYCCNLEIYTSDTESSSNGAAFDVVNRLMSPYLGCGRTLYVDSSYTSPDLFTYLWEKDTMACGSMKMNVNIGPFKKMIAEHKKNNTTFTRLTNGHLNFMYMDNSRVHLLTTAHDASMVATGKTDPVTNEAIMKLEADCDYRKRIGAVDRNNLMVAFNAFKRRTLKWWKKTFFYLFNLAVLNAYIIHRAREEKALPHRVFRRELAKQLVQQLIPVTSTQLHRVPQACGNSSLFRLSVQHYPQRVARKPGVKTRCPQRDCAVCSEQREGQRVRTSLECPICDVGLCPAPCFKIYHSERDFKGAGKRLREKKLRSKAKKRCKKN